MARDVTGRADRTRSRFPRFDLARDGVGDASALPSNEVVTIFLEIVRKVAVFCAVGPNANDRLALLMCVFDLPVNVLTVVRTG